jgi:hypothetical protein
MPQSKRNLFLTNTAIGVYVSLTGLILAVAPNIEALAGRGKDATQKANIADICAIATGTVGAIATLVGRYQAGGTYTPKYLPGDDPLPPLQ